MCKIRFFILVRDKLGYWVLCCMLLCWWFGLCLYVGMLLCCCCIIGVLFISVVICVM